MAFRKRERFAAGMALAGALCAAASLAGEPAVYVQSGDISAHSAVLWARCNRGQDARLIFDLAPAPYSFEDAGGGTIRSRIGPRVSAETDYTGSVLVPGLMPGQRYHYRARCLGRTGDGYGAEDVGGPGRFTTAPDAALPAPVRLVWTADLAGQGWGRNPKYSITAADGSAIQGGYTVLEVIRRLAPDFAVFAGDTVYADQPIPAAKPVPAEVGGGTWVNAPTKDFVAVTLAEYRANWRYNLGDESLQRLLREIPVYVQWDDHEVVNNWYPGEVLTAAPYRGLSADVLAGRGRRALFEYSPIAGPEIYRRFRYGRHLELFLLDQRSYRGPNTRNADPRGNEMLGEAQFEWLKRGLRQSAATWKLISAHDPLSIVTGNPKDRDAWAQGDHRVLGRERQLAALLRFIKRQGIENVVFISADVHFAAAISYRPERARSTDFEPFWEFVAGPVHAGAFGAGELDPSFGPSYEYLRAPSTEGLTIRNVPPPHLQSFGAAEVDADGRLTVRLHDGSGRVLFEKLLEPRLAQGPR